MKTRRPSAPTRIWIHDIDLACLRALSIEADLRRAVGAAVELINASPRARSSRANLVEETNRARALAREIESALGRARIAFPDIDIDIDIALASALTLTRERVLTRDRARNIDPGLDRDLAFLRDRADDLVGELSRINLIWAGGGQPAGKRAVPLARKLLEAAVILLPASSRTRYAEEFQSELAELAIAGARRLRQLTYAVRVITAVPQLRGDLRTPRRHRAGP
jgi:hypothetical protein